jgi:hypothetical protein
MKLHDRRWIRGQTKRIRAEVRSSDRLRRLHRGNMWSRRHTLPSAFVRLAISVILATVGWFGSMGNIGLIILTVWGWLVFWKRVTDLNAIPGSAAQIRLLPLHPADYFAHLWKHERRLTILLSIDALVVLGPWLQFHGFGLVGWLLAAFLSLITGVATFGLAAAIAAWVSAHVVGHVWLLTAAVVLTALFSQESTSALIVSFRDIVLETLRWATPVGWITQATESLTGLSAKAPSISLQSLLLAGAGLAAAATTPLSRKRLFGQINYDLPGTPFELREDDSDEFEVSPFSSLLPDELEELRSVVRSNFTIPQADSKPSRFRMIWEVLEMPGARWFSPINGTLYFVIAGLVLGFTSGWLGSAIQGVVLGIWTMIFALVYIPLLGGIWPGLTRSASGLRHVQTLALFPVGAWESAALMLAVNVVRVAIYGPVAVLVVSAGLVMFGADFLTCATRGGLVVAFIVMTQPALITGQFLNASRIHGCLTYLVVIPAVILALVAGFVFVGYFFSPFPTVGEALFIALPLAVLNLLAVAVMWLYSRRMFDVIK